jgi:hypothetical protein
MSATAFNDGRVNNLTLEKIIPRVVDTVNRSNVITMRVLSRPQAWSGRVVQQPIFTDNSTLGQSFKSTEEFSTAVDMNTVNMSWYPTGFGQPVNISTVERAMNQTEAGVINLYKTSFEYAQNAMSNRLGSIFYGTAAGKDFDGLNLIVDDGTLTSTYAGLTRTSYASNINADVTAAAGGVLDLDTLAAADDAATVSGLNSETPNIYITTKSIWTLYESLLEPTKQAMYQTMGYAKITSDTAVGETTRDSLRGRGGFDSLDSRGKPIVRDEKCTTGSIFLLNETMLEFHSLSIPGLKKVATANTVTEGVYDKVKPTAFQFRETMQPINQLAEVGIFVVYGNLVHRNPVRNAKITGVTTV